MESSVEGEELEGRVSSPTRMDEPDPRQSLQHVLAASDATPEATPRSILPSPSNLQSSPKRSTQWIQEGVKEHAEDERSVQNDSYTRAADINPSHTMTVAHSRRNANGTIGSVYSGNKIRHLKKDDGIPLWRKDIQFSFLRTVFEDKTPVFTRVGDGTRGHNFAEIYIHAMARSSKTSKILREKLLTEHEAAMNMAMVCLLVNVGRMNTTLNFFPEMRAQLRTYHSIPCLQAHQDPNAYKQLQDAPRLKSILKGACEEPDQPTTIEKIQVLPVPRTNPVNLIFVLSQYAPKVSETHFTQPRDFFDLVIRSTLSSRSRAKAFLWLIWWYLESDFSKEDAENNPFGPGQCGEGTDDMPFKVPSFEHLTEEQANAENIDTEEEKAFGELKRLERKRILEEDETVGPPLKKSMKSSGEYGLEERLADSPGAANMPSDTDRTRSPSPTGTGLNLWMPKPSGRSTNSTKLTGFRNENAASATRLDFERQQPTARLILKTRTDRLPESSSPAPPGSGHPVLHPNLQSSLHHRRSRPETSHQKAVNINRKMRVDNILHKKLVSAHRRACRKKREGTSSFGYQAMNRIIELPEDYDTEEDISWGPGGLVPNPGEDEDYGAEALIHKKVIDRAVRRLAREGQFGSLSDLSHSLRPHKRKARDYDDFDVREPGKSRKRNKNASDVRSLQAADGHENGSQEEGLDDLDLDLLGETRDDDHAEGMDDESGLDDTEEGDETDEEVADEVL